MSKTPKHLWAVDKAPTPLEYALAYAKLGWHVLPVWSVDADGQCRCGRPNSEKGHKPGKHPNTRLNEHGHLDATTDEAVIREWWSTDPEAGIGISLSASGLLALDIDPRNGGRDTLEELESTHGVLYSDCVAVTQGGGEHRLFSADANLSYPGTLGPGLDVKHHGYICVAPTLGPSGAYSWEQGRSPLSRSNPARPSDLPSLLAAKARQPTDYSLTERNGSPIATAQTFDDLRSALKHVDADDYTTWVNVGMVLKPYGENGYKVWTEWSATSDKFDAQAQRRKWERDISHPHSITYRSIFRMAIDAGWAGNTKKQQQAPGEDFHPMSLERKAPSGASQVQVIEYLFDHFMSTGINVMAGAPGVGKTTLVVPLALAAAHLCPSNFPLKPTIRRNVIIITESVIQVQRVVYSMYSWGCTGHAAADFDARVRVLPAMRLDPKIVAEVADEYRGWTTPNLRADGTEYMALPLVVFDTANAVFDLENENDNAEVGKAMAHMKQSFTGFPIIIVSHTSKILGTGDSDFLSPRGASAWTGDAQGVYTVFKDGDDAEAPRVMKATKVRFPTTFSEMTFELISNMERHPNVLGFEEDIWFSHSLARPLAPGERAAVKEEMADREEDKRADRMKMEFLTLIRSQPRQSKSFYSKLASSAGGVKGNTHKKKEVLEEMIRDGWLYEVELEEAVRTFTHYLSINEAAVVGEKGRYGV